MDNQMQKHGILTPTPCTQNRSEKGGFLRFKDEGNIKSATVEFITYAAEEHLL